MTNRNALSLIAGVEEPNYGLDPQKAAGPWQGLAQGEGPIKGGMFRAAPLGQGSDYNPATGVKWGQASQQAAQNLYGINSWGGQAQEQSKYGPGFNELYNKLGGLMGNSMKLMGDKNQWGNAVSDWADYERRLNQDTSGYFGGDFAKNWGSVVRGLNAKGPQVAGNTPAPLPPHITKTPPVGYTGPLVTNTNDFGYTTTPTGPAWGTQNPDGTVTAGTGLFGLTPGGTTSIVPLNPTSNMNTGGMIAQAGNQPTPTNNQYGHPAGTTYNAGYYMDGKELRYTNAQGNTAPVTNPDVIARFKAGKLNMVRAPWNQR